MPRKIEISHKTIIFTLAVLLSLGLLYQIKDIIFTFFVALLIMTILNPFVTNLSKKGVPRPISILISYIFAIVLFAVAIGGVVPPLIEQTSSFGRAIPSYLANIGVSPEIRDQLEGQIFSQLAGLPGKVVSVGVAVFSNILSLLLVMAFAFYLLSARDRLDDQLAYFFGEEKRREFGRIIDTLESRLGGWARGELTLMTLVGLANFIGLTFLGIPFALSLSILAGLLEIVPYLGPWMSGAIAVAIGLSISPFVGLAVAVLAFLIQQVENYIFVPKVMEKSVGVSPILTLLALTIGFRLVGIPGALISVPVVITLQVLAKEYFFKG